MKIKIVFSGLLVLLVALMFGCSVPSGPICGNGICSTGEDLTCPQDCGGVPESVARTAWKSAEPFGIVDWAQSGNTLTVVLKNNTASTLTYTGMSLGSNVQNDSNAIMAAYSTQIITFTTVECMAGSKYDYSKSDILIKYNSESINDKVMSGVADIVGTC